MTASELHSNLEILFGDVCASPKASEAARILELRVNRDIFEKLLRRWQGLPPGSRPALRGLSVSRGTDRAPLLLLEVGPRAPFLQLSVTSNSLPALTGVWPYAAWWEDELRGFESVTFPPRGADLGVEWRHA
ncbi:MAG: hypothetical protein ACXVB9_15610 [Bdellovibrionota bacterium]